MSTGKLLLGSKSIMKRIFEMCFSYCGLKNPISKELVVVKTLIVNHIRVSNLCLNPFSNEYNNLLLCIKVDSTDGNESV